MLILVQKCSTKVFLYLQRIGGERGKKYFLDKKTIMIHIIDLNFLKQEQSIASFLVETSAGPVLVESGPYSTIETLRKGVEKAGYKLEDIQHVFLSHIHFDHAGAAWFFAKHGATIYVHPRGSKHLADPTKLVSSARRIYKEMMDTLWGDIQGIDVDRIHVAQPEEEITVGDKTFKAWFTPGHAVHHIAWQMGEDIFTGDVAGVCINGGMVIPPCPPPDINVEDWESSIELLKGLDIKTMYLTHFGACTNVDQHLDSLQHHLWDWVEFIEPFYKNNTPIHEIVPQFQAHVMQQLRDYGISEADIEKYEAANPSFMSVSGLMRYWKKYGELAV